MSEWASKPIKCTVPIVCMSVDLFVSIVDCYVYFAASGDMLYNNQCYIHICLCARFFSSFEWMSVCEEFGQVIWMVLVGNFCGCGMWQL